MSTSDKVNFLLFTVCIFVFLYSYHLCAHASAISDVRGKYQRQQQIPMYLAHDDYKQFFSRSAAHPLH